MSNKTTLEVIEYTIKHDANLLQYFKPKSMDFSIQSFLKAEVSEVYSFYPLNDEFEFEYSLFKLFCFCNYSINDIYDLLKKCSAKNPKSDLNRLSYADFVNYTIAKHYEERKAVYEKTSEDYKKKLELKSAAESDYIKYLVDDYNNTNSIIDSMYSDMKYMCNDEDVSAEKRAEYINKCSKITNRLSDKRDFLINKIRSEDL